MQYSPQDREEFKKQIDELLELKVIRKTKSPHFPPAFMVNKHSEQKRANAYILIRKE